MDLIKNLSKVQKYAGMGAAAGIAAGAGYGAASDNTSALGAGAFTGAIGAAVGAAAGHRAGNIKSSVVSIAKKGVSEAKQKMKSVDPMAAKMSTGFDGKFTVRSLAGMGSGSAGIPAKKKVSKMTTALNAVRGTTNKYKNFVTGQWGKKKSGWDTIAADASVPRNNGPTAIDNAKSAAAAVSRNKSNGTFNVRASVGAAPTHPQSAAWQRNAKSAAKASSNNASSVGKNIGVVGSTGSKRARRKSVNGGWDDYNSSTRSRGREEDMAYRQRDRKKDGYALDKRMAI